MFYFFNNSFLWKSLDYHSGIFVPVLSECFPHTHACPPNKMNLVTEAGDDNMERRVGCFVLFCSFFF